MTVGNLRVGPLIEWPDGTFRSIEVPVSFTVSGSGFGTGPTAVLAGDWSLYEADTQAALDDMLVGEWDSGNYTNGLLPYYKELGGYSGITLREGGTNASTDNRLTGFLKTVDPYTDRFICYHLGVPSGRHFPGASAEETMPAVSSLKNHWESDGALDNATKADLVCLSWNGSDFVVGGNQAVTEAGGTPDSLYCGSGFSFNYWNRFAICQKAGTDPFVDAGYTQVHVTTEEGTRSRTRTSLPTFNSANSSDAQYTHINFPAWSGNGSQDLAQMLYRSYYLAIGANCQARVELINAATYEDATMISPPIIADSWSDTEVVFTPPEHWLTGMTHAVVTNSTGVQTIQELY